MLSKKKSEQLNYLMEMSLYGYCLSAGLSIAVSQIFVCTNILCYLFFFLKQDRQENKYINDIRRAGLLFILASLLCSLIGIDFGHSAKEVLKTLFYFVFPFSTLKSIQNDFSKKGYKALFLLLISQSIAATHTLISLSFPSLDVLKIPGAVTEAGQLVLVIPVAFAIFYYSSNKTSKIKTLSPIFLTLLFAALVLNLKRGPWMGVLFEFIFLGIFFSRKLILYSMLGCIIPLFINSVRERLAALGEHFLIDGGRYSMWQLGVDIFARFPLGLGLNNSNYMRVFDPSLPQTHRHMHNNLLNVAVETGIIGLAAYLYLFYTIYLLGKNIYQKSEQEIKLLALCITLSLFGWQVAGLVEYNFGDSEIRLIALMLLGILFSLSSELNDSQ